MAAMRIQSIVYPSYNDVEVKASEFDVDSDHVYAFAAAHVRLPANKSELQAWEKTINDQACALSGSGTPECEGVKSSGWDRVGHYWYGLIKHLGRMANTIDEYQQYLMEIGIRDATGRLKEGGHSPLGSDGYPPIGGTVGGSTGGSGTVVVCGQTLTWDTIDTGLRSVGYTGHYDHGSEEKAAYERSSCPGGGGGGGGGQQQKCDPVTNNPQLDTMICWVKQNTPLAIGGAALLYLLYRSRG